MHSNKGSLAILLLLVIVAVIAVIAILLVFTTASEAQENKFKCKCESDELGRFEFYVAINNSGKDAISSILRPTIFNIEIENSTVPCVCRKPLKIF